MFDSMQSLVGRNCAKCYVWLGRFEKLALKSEAVQRLGCPRCQQNLLHTVARERFGSQNHEKLAGSKHFWKLSSAKFAPRCGATAIRKPKSSPWRKSTLEVKNRQKLAFSDHFWKFSFGKFAPRCGESDSEAKIVKNWRSRGVFGGSKRFKIIFAWQAQGFRHVAKYVAGAGVREDCQKSWQAWWVWRGFETMLFAWQAQRFWALWNQYLNPGTEGLQISSHGSVTLQRSFCVAVTWVRMPQLNCFVAGAMLLKQPCCKIVKTFVILTSSMWSTYHFWRNAHRKASFFSFKPSIFQLQILIFERSLAEASFWSFEAWFLKEVSQNSFVFELQSFIFEGNLAE